MDWKFGDRFLKIGIFVKPHRTDFAGQLRQVLDWLQAHQCQPLVDREIVERFELNRTLGWDRQEIPRQADALLVFGGDGTMLSVARLVGANQCPILGFNLGSLGFLTELTLGELYPALERLISGDYRTESRGLLEARIQRTSGSGQSYHALNDAVINKGALARVISVDAFINEDFIANFVADGIIVATPTGSTAYSLSAGGPIVLPTLQSILITPICPHTLTNRPLLAPADHKMRFVIKSGEDVMLTIDGQVGVRLAEGDQVICTSSPYQIELVRPKDRNFFDVLREKLKWGERSLGAWQDPS